MAKLYSVKEIVELLNQEFKGTDIDYRYTEERVRARLRYAHSKGSITPKRMGFDRRAKFYTLEDIEKIKSEWIGPMPAEFTEHEEDLTMVDPEKEEVEVRSAKVGDVPSILKLLPSDNEEMENLIPYLTKTLRSSQSTNFVALLNEEIVGWGQVEISAGISLLKGEATGIIRVFVPIDKTVKIIALRSLIYRAEQWLLQLSVHHMILEIPKSLSNLEKFIREDLYYDYESEISLMSKSLK